MKSIRNTILQFLDIFNNITINKYNSQGEVIKTVTVPVKMASKEKSYMWAKDRAATQSLPMIAVELVSIMHDPQRVSNSTQEVVFDKLPSAKSYSFFYNPAPYNLDFTVHLIANYIVEADQILEQICSVFNPYIQTRIKVSDYSNTTIDLKVLFTGATPIHSTELDETEYRLIRWTLSFTVNSFMLRPATMVSPETSGGLITSVVRRYWSGETDDIMEAAIRDGDLSNIPTSGSGYMMTAITSGLGYDESAKLLYSYEVYEKEDI